MYVYEVNVCDTYGGVDVSVNAPGGPVLVLNRYTYIVFYQVESFTSCEKEKEGEVSGGCSLDSGCACIWVTKPYYCPTRKFTRSVLSLTLPCAEMAKCAKCGTTTRQKWDDRMG